MSRTDTIFSLDQEDSAQILDMVGDFSLDPQSPKLANAVFGIARKRSLGSKLKEPPRRDSQTLPVTNASKKSSMEVNKRLPAPPRTRPDSPDIGTILSKTPRPQRKKSGSMFSSSRSQGSTSTKTSPKIDSKAFPDHSVSSLYSSLFDDESDGDDGGSYESDSSIDIHTPLPHLMFRDGLLSPRSKLLPQSTSSHSIYSSIGDHAFDATGSVLSLVSTSGSVVTKTGLQKDPRDTERRRMRHRDGKLLKLGMGLTTGLGWSDSEDEDAPSALTRRFITTTAERQRSGSGSSSRPNSSYENTSFSRLTSPTPALSRKPVSHSNLRSTSISFPTKSPVSPASGPGSGLRIPRGRAASAASVGPSRSTPFKSTLPPVRSESPVPGPGPQATSDPVTPRPPFAFSPFTEPESPSASSVSLASNSVGRRRAESSASTTSFGTSTSTASSPPPSRPRTAPRSAPATTTTTTVNTRVPGAPGFRARTESSTSNSTDITAESSAPSNYSHNSSSTSVPSSTSSGVPRPLRLPQGHVTGIKPPSRSYSQDTTGPQRSVSSGVPAFFQRPRTVSSPHSPRGYPSNMYMPSVRTTANSVSSGVLPAGAPPTLRQRQTPTGARPRPRTGTGMIYRTSSYTSFHETGSRMRGSSVVSP